MSRKNRTDESETEALTGSAGFVRKQSRTEEIGNTGLVRYGGDIEEEFHRLLRGRQGVEAYREMRDNDATIGASLLLITSLLRQVQWHAQPADESPKSAEAAEFLEEAIKDMEDTWGGFITEVLSMLWFGWSYFEKVFKVRRGPNESSPTHRSKFSDGKIGWRKIEIRAQESLEEWQFNEETDQLEGMWQDSVTKQERVFIPLPKSILFRTDKNKDNPEGRSCLRSAWRAWFFLKRLQELEAIGIERDLVGLPVMELPASYMGTDSKVGVEKKAQRAAFATLVQQIRRNEHEGLVIPSELDRENKPTGFRLRLLTSGGSRQIDISGSVQTYKKDIAMSMLTQFLFLGMDKTGSFALASEITDVFAVSLGAVLDIIQETFDPHVAELMNLNGIPVENHPTWTHGDIEKRDAAKLSDTLLKLAQAGFLTPDMPIETQIREELGLPVQEEPKEGEEPRNTLSQPSERPLDNTEQQAQGQADQNSNGTQSEPEDLSEPNGLPN